MDAKNSATVCKVGETLFSSAWICWKGPEPASSLQLVSCQVFDWGLLASCWFSDIVQFCKSLNSSGGSQDFFSSFTELRHLSTVQLGYQLPAAQLPSPLHPQPRRGDPPQQCLQHHLRLGEGGREDNRWVLKLRQSKDGLSPLFFTGFFLFAAQLLYPPNVNSPFFSLSQNGFCLLCTFVCGKSATLHQGRSPKPSYILYIRGYRTICF